MKIKFMLDLEDDDVIEEVFNEDDDYNSYYQLKNSENIQEEILEQLKKEIISNITFGKISNKVFEKFINENKELIINAVVSKVSKSIINNKAIKDFKKSLEEEND